MFSGNNQKPPAWLIHASYRESMRQDIWQEPSLSSSQQKQREAKSRVRVSEKTASPGYESELFFQKSRL
jgi:hypothetical protein